MKKIYIIIILYILLLSGVFYSATIIRPMLHKTPVERALITKNGAASRIRMSQRILHDETVPATEAPTMDIRDGETALEVLKRTHPTETKDYSFGTLVEAIDGVKNGKDDKYWILYINGTQSTVGADAYTIQKDDALEWRFERYAE